MIPESAGAARVPSPSIRKGPVLIERVGSMDLTVTVADRGSVPTNLGAIVIFDGVGPTPAEVRTVLHCVCVPGHLAEVRRPDRRCPPCPRRWPGRTIGSLPSSLRRGRAGLHELGLGWTRLRPVERLSVLRPTS